MNILHYRSWLFLEGFYLPTGLCGPLFAVSAVHADCSSKFCKPKSSVFCLYNRQLNCKNSAQNALEVDTLRSKVKNTPSLHPASTPFGAFGASIVAPAALDLVLPPFANPGSATGGNPSQKSQNSAG